MGTTGPIRRILAVSLTMALPVAHASEIALQSIDDHADRYSALAQEIWGLAEVGYKEFESSRLLQEALAGEGFQIREGVASIPTAFVASYGSGDPVIAVMGEFDALPGISQAAEPIPTPLDNRNTAHACGHHLFGVGSLGAAVAVKDWLKASDREGTVRFYGTPAEEGGSGKVYMVRAGEFDDVDAVLTWHPDDENNPSPRTSLANRSAKFRFRGRASHAAMAPEFGRSALDGVEAMNYMVNLLREHMPTNARIHYVITEGGDAPNVVPAAAEVFYYVRSPKAAQVESLFERVVKAAEGAAAGTETSMTYEIIHGNHSLLPNHALARVVEGNLRQLGGVRYDPEDLEFARRLSKTLFGAPNKLGSEEKIQAFQPVAGFGSTDVGDVSWVVPTTELRIATWVPGTVAHSWQAVAAGGTGIGSKGMLLAARTMALSAIQLFEQPALMAEAQQEFLKARGEGFVYRSLLGDRKPPLDYRD